MNLLELITRPFIIGAAWVDARPSGGTMRRTLDQVRAVQTGETGEIQTPHGSPLLVLEGASHAPSVQAGMQFARRLTRSQCAQVRRQAKMEAMALERMAECADTRREPEPDLT